MQISGGPLADNRSARCQKGPFGRPLKRPFGANAHFFWQTG
jgi:hypothetical protein